MHNNHSSIVIHAGSKALQLEVYMNESTDGAGTKTPQDETNPPKVEDYAVESQDYSKGEIILTNYERNPPQESASQAQAKLPKHSINKTWI